MEKKILKNPRGEEKMWVRNFPDQKRTNESSQSGKLERNDHKAREIKKFKTSFRDNIMPDVDKGFKTKTTSKRRNNLKI